VNAPAPDDEARQYAKRNGSLDLLLREHIWNDHPWLVLGGEQFEPVGHDEVPGYEYEEYAVLLRRRSDGQVFLADINVTVDPVGKPAAVTT
jgi:hypothetical protein